MLFYIICPKCKKQLYFDSITEEPFTAICSHCNANIVMCQASLRKKMHVIEGATQQKESDVEAEDVPSVQPDTGMKRVLKKTAEIVAGAVEKANEKYSEAEETLQIRNYDLWDEKRLKMEEKRTGSFFEKLLIRRRLYDLEHCEDEEES